LKKLLKEPLFHFLLLGGGFFSLFAVVSEDSDFEGDQLEEIVVTEGRIASIVIQFGKVWQRPPTEEELDGLITDYVREEVLYREAVAMGLDRDDTIVRRRMRQKLEFLSEDIGALAEPTEEELQAYLSEQPEQFRQENRFSFRQVFINTDNRGKNAEGHGLALLAQLRKNDEGAATLGDSLMLQFEFENQNERDVERILGKRFLDSLLETPTGSWQGPVVSGFGLHLVHVSERLDGRAPALAEVRDAVVREWSAAKQKQTNEEFYEMLRKRYTVTVMKPGTENVSQMAGADQ
jgi:hypothetical protein